MITAKLWRPQRGSKARLHALRERRARFGELIQIDGSAHAWFEQRGPRCCLLVFIDDATSRLTQLRFVPQQPGQRGDDRGPTARLRLLLVDGVGHPSFVAPSACRDAAVATYLVDLVLPAAGTTCPSDTQPFG